MKSWAVVLAALLLVGYGAAQDTAEATGENTARYYTKDSFLGDVIADPVFTDYGRLLFPSDGIASYRTMERCIHAIKANGTDTENEVFSGLPHGFGLGIGTVAEGWIDNAVAFWERQM